MEEKHIALICDDNYAMPTAVTIQSINHYSNKDKTIYIVHVCTFGLEKDSVLLLTNLETDNIRIHIDLFDKKLFEERLASVKQMTHVTPVALIKFELAERYKDIDRLLYIDSDIIVKSDLLDLFVVNLENRYLAASFEFHHHMNNLRYNIHGTTDEEFYFNSGVMLLNLNEFRKERISQKLWDYKLNNTKTKLMDQECFNAVCGSKVFPLSIKWNFNPVFLNENYIAEINTVYKENYKSTSEMKEDIKIIHYVGKRDKPWVYKNARMQEQWLQEYNCLELETELTLIEYVSPKRGIIKKIVEKISSQGLVGFFSYLRYKIMGK